MPRVLPRWLAVHEAGHAAAGCSMFDGPSVDWLSIGRNPTGYYGLTKYTADFVRRPREGIERAICKLAGPVAEYRFRRRSMLDFYGRYRFAHTSDYRDAMKIAEENGDEMDWYFGETIEIVKRNWPIILKLSDQLLAETDIDAAGLPFAMIWPQR